MSDKLTSTKVDFETVLAHVRAAAVARVAELRQQYPASYGTGSDPDGLRGRGPDTRSNAPRFSARCLVSYVFADRVAYGNTATRERARQQVLKALRHLTQTEELLQVERDVTTRREQFALMTDDLRNECEADQRREQERQELCAKLGGEAALGGVLLSVDAARNLLARLEGAEDRARSLEARASLVCAL